MAAGGRGNRRNPSLTDRGDLCGPSGCGKPCRAVVFSGLLCGAIGLPGGVDHVDTGGIPDPWARDRKRDLGEMSNRPSRGMSRLTRLYRTSSCDSSDPRSRVSSSERPLYQIEVR